MNRAGVPAPAGRTWGRAAWAAAGVIAATAAVVGAEQATVRRPTANVVDAKGSAGEVIEALPRGTSLEVLGREGHWLRVRTPGGKVGYLAEASTQAGSDTSAAAGLTGGQVTRTDAAAAGRGDFDREVTAYADSKGLDTAGLRKMEEARQACIGKPLQEFEKQGHVGTAGR